MECATEVIGQKKIVPLTCSSLKERNRVGSFMRMELWLGPHCR